MLVRWGLYEFCPLYKMEANRLWFPCLCELCPSALLLLELVCLPSISWNWEQSSAHFVASFFWDRTRVVWERKGGLLSEYPGQWAYSCRELGLEGWCSESMLGALSEFSLVSSWKGYIRYRHRVTAKGRLEKENSTAVSSHPGWLNTAEALLKVWLQSSNCPWHFIFMASLTERTSSLPKLSFSRLTLKIYGNIFGFRNNTGVTRYSLADLRSRLLHFSNLSAGFKAMV